MKSILLAGAATLASMLFVPAPAIAQQGEVKQRLCPNGQYVVGTGCYLTPDGSYTGYKPQLAPNGTYVGGKPRLAPNGQYIGGQPQQRTILCPNGAYVVGTRCRLMPDGSYRGE